MRWRYPSPSKVLLLIPAINRRKTDKSMSQKPYMMNSMMKNGNMMPQMMQMMNQKGMISDECLQSGMQRMKDQGMPMNMNMGMMKPDEGVESHESQH